MVALERAGRYHGCAMTVKRTRKPTHSDAERAALASRLQATFRKGTAVTTWVRAHHAELTRLTRGPGSWSWAELAEVLNATRIRYEAGTRRADGGVSTGLWSEAMLKAKVQAGRVAERGRSAAQMPATIEATIRATIMELLGRDQRLEGEAVSQAASSPDTAPPTVQPIPAPPAPVEPPDAPPPSRPRVRVIGAQLPESQPEEGLKISELTKSVLADFLKDRKSSGKS